MAKCINQSPVRQEDFSANRSGFCNTWLLIVVSILERKTDKFLLIAIQQDQLTACLQEVSFKPIAYSFFIKSAKIILYIDALRHQKLILVLIF